MGLQSYEDVITDETFKCFVHCMSVKPGIIYTNGTLNMKNVLSILEITDQNMLNQLDAKCKNPKLEEKCSAAQDTILCIFKQFNTD